MRQVRPRRPEPLRPHPTGPGFPFVRSLHAIGSESRRTFLLWTRTPATCGSVTPRPTLRSPSTSIPWTSTATKYWHLQLQARALGHGHLAHLASAPSASRKCPNLGCQSCHHTAAGLRSAPLRARHLACAQPRHRRPLHPCIERKHADAEDCQERRSHCPPRRV